MRKVVSIYILTFTLLASCQNTQSVKKTNQLDEIVLDSIIKTYDGKINLYKGVEIDDEKKINYVELSIEKSLTLEDYNNHEYLPPSNLAYILDFHYSQKNIKYDKYKVNLQYESGLKSYEYSLEKISKARKCYEEVINFCNYWKDKDYEKVNLGIQEDFLKFKKNEFIEVAKSIDEKQGDIEKVTLTGFIFNKIDSGEEFIKVFGVLKRSGRNSLFTAYINPVNYKIFAIDLKW